jgi:hypothetical protein
MARHTKILLGEPVANDNETGNLLAKEINDLIATATAYTVTATKFGSRIAIIVNYDTA